jgi:hypothetical protein
MSDSVPPPGGPTCDSCGRDEDDLARAHRVYVVPESWDTPGSVTVQDEVEVWCFSCRTHYPHQPLDDVQDGDAGSAG